MYPSATNATLRPHSVTWETVALCTKTASLRGATAKTGVHPEVNIILFCIDVEAKYFIFIDFEANSIILRCI